ncbi:MAG TPA: aromatic acid exporter family protein [Bacilli bacterium]|nr:aromatic acid exporter family protein [Bacilli bacterium]
MKIKLFLLFKMIIGFLLGVIIADLLHLDYYYTAGVFVVLNLEVSRKPTFLNSLKRLIDATIGLLLAVAIFSLLNINVYTLALLVIIFIPLSFLLNIEKGLPSSLVVISHLYINQDPTKVYNALYIVLVSVAIAFALNLITPPLKKQVQSTIKMVDQKLNDLLVQVAHSRKVDFQQIDNYLLQAEKNLIQDIENHLFPYALRRQDYLAMRKEQISILKRIAATLDGVDRIREKEMILDYLSTFEGNIGEENYAAFLKEELNKLLMRFRDENLPTTRDEFEKRAHLYHVLMELEQFLNLKMQYHDKYAVN